MLHFIALYYMFYTFKICGNTESSQFFGIIFSNSIAHFVSLCHILVVVVVVAVHSLSGAQIIATPWTAASQASSLSFYHLMELAQSHAHWVGHPTISFSIIPFSSGLLSFPASKSFPMSQLFVSGGLNIGVLASGSVLPMNIQGWFPLRLTGLISLEFKGFSIVFSNTIAQKHQFKKHQAQFSLWSNPHIRTWLLEKP